MTQKKRYDIRFQLYRHDKLRLEALAKGNSRSVANQTKLIVMEYLDSFQQALKEDNELGEKKA